MVPFKKRGTILVPLNKGAQFLQKGTKILVVAQRALFNGTSNSALRAPLLYRLFFLVNFSPNYLEADIKRTV